MLFPRLKVRSEERLFSRLNVVLEEEESFLSMESILIAT